MPECICLAHDKAAAWRRLNAYRIWTDLAFYRLCCTALHPFLLQILWEQAQRGEQPGLMLMQDALSGEKKAQTWGNEPTIMEPDNQN